MPREAEVDEPLLVQPPGHLLKDLDTTRVVLDEVVVGREDGGDTILYPKLWDQNVDITKCRLVNYWSCCATRICLYPFPLIHQEVVDERRIMFRTINDNAIDLLVRKSRPIY